MSGSAYVFGRNEGGADNWGQAKKLLASDGAAGEYLGRSVSVSGDTVVVGAYRGDVGSEIDCGSAYVFERPATAGDDGDDGGGGCGGCSHGAGGPSGLAFCVLIPYLALKRREWRNRR